MLLSLMKTGYLSRNESDKTTKVSENKIIIAVKPNELIRRNFTHFGTNDIKYKR